MVPGPQVEEAFSRVGADFVAKYLFTSGSTGMPKGVINTQKMICANQQMIAQTRVSLDPHFPVVVDWLPWNHTMGGNGLFNYVLWNQGTLYIDAGRPLPGMFDETIKRPSSLVDILRDNIKHNLISGELFLGEWLDVGTIERLNRAHNKFGKS